MAKGPKKKCCLSKPRCKRCPLRMLAEGTLPAGYTVRKRRLIPPDRGQWPEAEMPEWALASPTKTKKAKKKAKKKRETDATAAAKTKKHKKNKRKRELPASSGPPRVA